MHDYLPATRHAQLLRSLLISVRLAPVLSSNEMRNNRRDFKIYLFTTEKYSVIIRSLRQ